MPHPLLSSDIKNQFTAVNEYILNHLDSKVPLVEEIANYIVDSGGKRLRPILVLLAAQACNYKGQAQIPLAACIEFIHTATLLHDDVVDNSSLRRGKNTANAEWGNAESILVGDFLYSRAFQLIVETCNPEIVRIMSDATNQIAEGEVMQLLNANNPDTTEAAYMEVVLHKTAKLFEAATESAALLAQAADAEKQALKDYGRHLGIAFQLIDDVMDYSAKPNEMGKNVGDDLAEGKPTLPLIHAMNHGRLEDKNLIRRAIRESRLEDLDKVISIVQKTKSIEVTKARAQKEIDKALTALSLLEKNSGTKSLRKIAEIAISRTS